MLKILVGCLIHFLLAACGIRAESSQLQSIRDEPDNTPIRSECLGGDSITGKFTQVGWDDQSELRVCLILQKDNALGFDIQLRSGANELKAHSLAVELNSPSGQKHQAMYPLVWNPFNGIYQLQLSQGCLIGKPGGCDQEAPESMRELFKSIPHSELNWHGAFFLQLAVISSEQKSNSTLGQSKVTKTSRKLLMTWPANSQKFERQQLQRKESNFSR